MGRRGTLIAVALAAHSLGTARAQRVETVSAACSATSTCSAAILAAMQSCAAGPGPCSVLLDAGGVYMMEGATGSHVVNAPAGLSSFVLDGQGAELRYLGLTGGFTFTGGDNLTVRNLQIDSVRLPYSYGLVVASAAGAATVRVNATDYPPPANAEQAAWMNAVQAVLSFDPVANRPAVNAVDIYALSPAIPASWSAPAGGLCNLTVQTTLPVGAWVILRHQVYGLDAFDVSLTTNVVMENIVLYSTPGMGIFTNAVTNITLSNFQVRKRGTRPMSITADGLHFMSCRGGAVLVDSCVFEGQGDDGGNIPARYWEIESITGSNRTELVVGRDGAPTAFEGQVGDRLRFYDRTTFATYFETTLAALNAAASTVSLASPLPAQGAQWDLLVDLDNEPASVHIRNCTFRANRARGHLLKASNLLVEQCLFDHTTGPAVQAYPDGVHWYEGDVLVNWTFRNNTILGCNYGPAKMPGDVFLAAQVPVWGPNHVPSNNNGNPATVGQQHVNVTIVDNVFVQDQGQAAVFVYGIDGLVVEDNEVTQSGPSAAVNFFASNSVRTTLGPNECGSACKYGGQ